MAQRVQVLLGLAVFQLAHLRLGESEPTPQKLLVQRLAVQLKVPGVIAVGLEDLADVLTLERRPELVGLKKSSRSWVGGVRS